MSKFALGHGDKVHRAKVPGGGTVILAPDAPLSFPTTLMSEDRCLGLSLSLNPKLVLNRTLSHQLFTIRSPVPDILAALTIV